MPSPIVTVIILTYNQELTIRQCVDSVLAQETEFPFEVIIGEDMGKDQTRAICEQYVKDYANVFLPSRTHNLGVTMNWVKCVQEARGKYVMTVGGDDYWHNPQKIQIQVDFMEKHPECVICHTDYDILFTKTNRLSRCRNSTKGVVPPEGMIQKEAISGRENIAAGTMCIRRDIVSMRRNNSLVKTGPQ